VSRSPRRPVPPPLEANDQIVATIITGGWAIALVILLALWTHISAADRWWIWTCAAGVGLGLFGMAYVPYLKRSRARLAQRRAAARSGPAR
jgi:Protein of unknown function (DUF2530)